MLKRFTSFILPAALLCAAACAFNARAQKAEEKATKAVPPSSKEVKEARARIAKGELTAEQVAEAVIYIYGTRPALEQVRKNGDERGKMTRRADDGKTEEITYERRFIRGESSEKDKQRLDQKTPTAEYALVYNDKRVFGVINGTQFTPRQQAVSDFLSQSQHSLDTLLRYKENNSTLNLIGKDKQKNIELWVLDVTDKEKRTTRFYISAQKYRVLALEYDETPAPGAQAIKYRREFHDYTYAQGTLVPYRTVFYADGKQIAESRVMTVSYGVKMDDALFQPSEPSTANASQ